MPGQTYRLQNGIASRNSTSLQNAGIALKFPAVPHDGFFWNDEANFSLACGILYSSQFQNNVVMVSAIQSPNGEIGLRMNAQGAPLTMSAATQVNVGAASSSILAANTARRYALISNTHATQRLSLAFGAAAAADTGITLQAGQSYEISEAAGNLTLQEIRAWASGANTLVGVQEGV